MSLDSALLRLANIAHDQWGLVTRRQADHAGVPPSTLARFVSEGNMLERVAHGVYLLRAAPTPDHLELRAAWLQLAPGVLAFDRAVDEGVVSHRSAAALAGIGHLPADRHEFTIAARKQTRRADVRLHHRPLSAGDIVMVGGLPSTRPSRIAADLIRNREDPDAIAQIVQDAIRSGAESTAAFEMALAPLAAALGLRPRDARALREWVLDLERAQTRASIIG